ncbi:NHL repeat-containing protein [Candidatus Bathyarchaeota archaeon]|nr:NHL repeat-containing protein [Candidatus Bathyarchaeota archaeon]
MVACARNGTRSNPLEIGRTPSADYSFSPPATDAAPGLNWTLDQLTRLGEQSGLGKSYPVVVDDDVAWQAVISSLGEYTEVQWAGGSMAPPIVGSLILISPTHTSWMDPYVDEYQSPVQISGWPTIGDALVYIPKQLASSTSAPRVPTLAVPPVTIEPADLLKIGGTGSGEGQLDEPTDVSVDQAGNIYVSEGRNNRIQVFDKNGSPLRTLQPAGDNALNEPWSVAVAGDGSIYVSDTWNYRVDKYDASFNLIWKSDSVIGLYGPRDILVLPDGNILVADSGDKRIVKLSGSDGSLLGTFGSGGSGPGQFNEVTGLALDSDGNVYVADTWNGRVQRFDSSLKYLGEFAVKGWSSQEVTAKPYLAVLPNSRVVLSIPAQGRIEVRDKDGSQLAIWELPTTVNGVKGRPVGMSVDAKNNFLYVADCVGNTVYRIPLASLRNMSE